MAKILCVLYDDPVMGNPKEMIRDDIPQLSRYPDGQKLPTPSKIDFTEEPEDGVAMVIPGLSPLKPVTGSTYLPK